jgi:hypothetical protein
MTGVVPDNVMFALAVHRGWENTDMRKDLIEDMKYRLTNVYKEKYN